MSEIICPRCQGKGKAKLSGQKLNPFGNNFNDDDDNIANDVAVINCPVCNGTGKLMDNNNDFLTQRNEDEDEDNFAGNNMNNTQIKTENVNLDNTQEIVLNLLVKYPSLFSSSIELKYENTEDVLNFLKNNSIFKISINSNFLTIGIEEKYKNKLAEYTINFLKNQLKSINTSN